MALSTGERLGSYEILELLGAGGMGEVYRARDERLDREVAIKVLPEELEQDADRLARFEREARVLASLNHPNIATLYGLEEHEGRRHLVMELAAGETLAVRLDRGELSVDDALQIARQIAEALETAHEHGIIHRDLKPANVMLSAEGKVRVLDFGLAKAWEPADSSPDLTRSPTLTAQMTGAGVLLGTAAYMSPEQARGRPVDRRADVWAFGCILHEMLSGRRLFVGDTVSDVLASVLTSEIDVDAVPPETPPSVRRLLRRSLQRDPARRLRDLGDAILELDEYEVELPRAKAATGGSAAKYIGWVAAMVALIVAIALAWHMSRAPVHREIVYTEIAPPAGAEFAFHGDRGSPPVIAPDGSAVVFGAVVPGEPVTLWLRSLRTGETSQLPGTEGGFAPFWSPDSRSIAFFDFSSLKRLDVGGGATLTLCTARIARGGVWTPEGKIIFAPEYNTGLSRVSATGGEPTPLTTLLENRHTSHRWPVLLPDGRHLVYLAISHDTGDARENEVRVVATDGTGDRRIVSSSANGAVAADHLFFMRDQALMAQPLNAQRDGITGEPRIVARDVFHDANTWRSVFTVGGDLLLYQSSAAGLNAQLTLIDRDGQELGTVGDDDIYTDLAVSPDGRHLAVCAGSPPDIWIIEIETGLRTRLTFETNATAPLWSPDGREIYYRQWDADHPSRIMVKSASGAGEARAVLDDPELLFMPADVTADGRYLILDEVYYVSGADVWFMDLVNNTQPMKVIDRPENQTIPDVSPDGRWIAYSSGEAGALTVYIEPFEPESAAGGTSRRAGRWQVSDSSGVLPRWDSDGETLVFLSFEGRLMEVEVEVVGDGLRIGPSRIIGQTSAASSQRSIDLIPGTDQIVVINPAAQTQTPLTTVIGLRRLLAETKR
jgi:Tol biopolymer transport system component